MSKILPFEVLKKLPEGIPKRFAVSTGFIDQTRNDVMKSQPLGRVQMIIEQ